MPRQVQRSWSLHRTLVWLASSLQAELRDHCEGFPQSCLLVQQLLQALQVEGAVQVQASAAEAKVVDPRVRFTDGIPYEVAEVQA